MIARITIIVLIAATIVYALLKLATATNFFTPARIRSIAINAALVLTSFIVGLIVMYAISGVDTLL